MAVPSGYFNTDRAVKYGWGLPRLALLTLAAFQLAPAVNYEGFGELGGYLASGRWAAHLYLGTIGAAVNVELNGFALNLALLLVAAGLCVWDAACFPRYPILVYLCKTFSGDFLAGKLDSKEWKLVLFFTFGVLAPAVCLWERGSAQEQLLGPYGRILPLLFLVQTVCEVGDAHYEHWRFFRHRYSFEALTAALLFLGAAHTGSSVDSNGLSGSGASGAWWWLAALTPAELEVLQLDLVVCLAYRASNLAIILHKAVGGVGGVRTALGNGLRKASFAAFGLLRGRRLVNVTDVDLAMQVLKYGGSTKGLALERFVATPAWLPLISLESVDGPEHAAMIKDFHLLLKALPQPPRALGPTTARLVESLVASAVAADRPVDAHDIAKLTVEAFVEHVFGMTWAEADLVGGDCGGLQAIVDASWEWRKEIAVKGRADPGAKARAIAVLLRLLESSKGGGAGNSDSSGNGESGGRRSSLWALFGERWREPRYYSLLMQPFLISPCINAGDVAVSLKHFPHLGLEDCMRAAHPFPILERLVERDIPFPPCSAQGSGGGGGGGAGAAKGSGVAISAGTQVIMFPADWAGKALGGAGGSPATPQSAGGGGGDGWPVFGAGPRACAGVSLALPFLRALEDGLRGGATEAGGGGGGGVLGIRAKGASAGPGGRGAEAAAANAVAVPADTVLPARLFCPESGHRFSGRNNDSDLDLASAWHFAKTIVPVLLFAK